MTEPVDIVVAARPGPGDISSSPSRSIDKPIATLDTIAAVLPIDRRDELGELLTDQDVETLRHLVNEGMGANTLRALTSDLGLVAGRHRQISALAGTRGPSPEIRCPSSVAARAARHRPSPRHAIRCRAKLARPALPSVVRPACARYGAPAACQLVDADQMARC